ncbi:MAG: hypothetical protein ACKOCI_10400, partial [Cyanobium sp.]
METREARGSEKTYPRLARKFGWDPASNAFFAPFEKHILFFGHMGSVKCTLLGLFSEDVMAWWRFFVVEVYLLVKLDCNYVQLS